MTQTANRRTTAFSLAALVACVAIAAWIEVVGPIRLVTRASPSVVGSEAVGSSPGPVGSAPGFPELSPPTSLVTSATAQPGQGGAVGGPEPQTFDLEAPPLAPMAPGGHVPAGPPVATGEAAALRFVYFVELDQEYDPQAVELIAQQARALQQLWFDQFGGTFAVPETIDVVYGDHEASWYDTTPLGDDPRWFRLMNIRDEVRLDLGVAPDDATVRFLAYPSSRIDGRVGANRYGGAVMDGDDLACISGRIATTPYSADYPANCLATVAHELGHVFGLTHQGPDEDCMQFGFYHYVTRDVVCQFSADNRAQVINDPYNEPWLAARPGDTARPTSGPGPAAEPTP